MVIIPETNGTGRGKDGARIHAIISTHDVSVISFGITDEHVHEEKAGRKILESLRDRMAKIFGDKGYGS